MTTSYQFSTNFVGCHCDTKSSTSWPSWYSSRCWAKPHYTCRRNASYNVYNAWRCHLHYVNVSICVIQGLDDTDDTSVIHWTTEVSLSMGHKFGTVYPAFCNNLTWTCSVQTTIKNIFVYLRPQHTNDLLCF